MARENYVYTLEEWVEENDMSSLQSDIACHVEQYVNHEEWVEDLTRLIMISIRQELQDRGMADEE